MSSHRLTCGVGLGTISQAPLAAAHRARPLVQRCLPRLAPQTARPVAR